MEELRQTIHQFLVEDFNLILRWEEKVLGSYAQGKLSVNEFHVIETVLGAMKTGQNTMGEISRRMSITMGTLTTSVKTLENKGFLLRQRGEQDRRTVWILPTPAAMEANRFHQVFHDRLVGGVMDCLDRQQLSSLAAALGMLAQWLSSLEREEHYISVEPDTQEE